MIGGFLFQGDQMMAGSYMSVKLGDGEVAEQIGMQFKYVHARTSVGSVYSYDRLEDTVSLVWIRFKADQTPWM